MSKIADEFLVALDARRAATLNDCTACGKCVEVCPMPGPAGIDASDPETIASGILDIIRTGPRYRPSCHRTRTELTKR